MNDAVVYDIPTDEAIAITTGLMRVYEKLGKPQDLSTNTGWVLMDNIFQVWKRIYPNEVRSWAHDLDQDLQDEKTIKELVKNDVGMYNPITYPPALFSLIKSMFPEIKLNDRKLIKQMTDRYPILKTTNYSI